VVCQHINMSNINISTLGLKSVKLLLLFPGAPEMCSEVLRTACMVVKGLQPLSLANETQIPPLGLKALRDIAGFLCKTSLPTSGADATGSFSQRQSPSPKFNQNIVGRYYTLPRQPKKLMLWDREYPSSKSWINPSELRCRLK
jgi:hypothetical protein